MTRPNIALIGGWLNIVGGLGRSGALAYGDYPLDAEFMAECVDPKPIFAHETTYFRFRVPGTGFDLLVPIENLRAQVPRP